MKKLFFIASFVLTSFLQSQNCVIPVIVHVIHGGQTPGSYPNIAQAQINSQIQVLNDDYAGTGYNSTLYPVNAFTTFATNTIIAAASKDVLGRIKIANTGITFCLALYDSLGNTLPEPGIHRVDYNTLPALTGTFTSKNPANSVYNTSAKFMSFMDGYIKPNTIWNCTKYLNIWLTATNSGMLLAGYTTFPPASTLPGLSGFGTKTTDGVWVRTNCFGSSAIYPGGTYAPAYDLGRVCTHETGHYFGLTHTAGSCPGNSDWCDDTPGSSSSVATCTTSYPFNAGTCTSYPSNSPDGEMYMNFMGYSEDCAMYMFTQDQSNRMNVARSNSPYRKLLGLHGLCPVSCPLSINENEVENRFNIYPNPASNYFVIELKQKTISLVEIYDATGRLIVKQASDSGTIKINTGAFSKGLYFVNISAEGATKMKKLVIE